MLDIVSLMHYDLGFIDLRTKNPATLDPPSAQGVPCLRYVPVSLHSVPHVSGPDSGLAVREEGSKPSSPGRAGLESAACRTLGR